MISSITGLGFLIDDARWQMRPDIMVAGMITIAMIGRVMEHWALGDEGRAAVRPPCRWPRATTAFRAREVA